MSRDRRKLTPHRPGDGSLNCQGQEHHLFINEQGEYELVEINHVPHLPFSKVRAYWFNRDSRPDDTYILIWAEDLGTYLHLPAAVDKLEVMRPFGTRLQTNLDKDGRPVVEVARRKYLVFPNMNPQDAMESLRRAVEGKKISDTKNKKQKNVKDDGHTEMAR